MIDIDIKQLADEDRSECIDNTVIRGAELLVRSVESSDKPNYILGCALELLNGFHGINIPDSRIIELKNVKCYSPMDNSIMSYTTEKIKEAKQLLKKQYEV